MGLGFEKRRIYLGIKDGKVQRKNPDGGSEAFDYVEGHIQAVRTESVDFKFGETRMVKFDILDPESQELYCLGLSLHGSVARSILNCLVGAGRLGLVHIRPYKNKAGFNAVFLTNDGAKLSWAEPFPEKTVDRKGVVDDSAREAYTEELAVRVINKVAAERQGWPASGAGVAAPLSMGTDHAQVNIDDDIPF